MTEIFEFRILRDNYHLLSQPNPAVYNGAIWVLKITREDPLFDEIKDLNNYFRTELGTLFYLYSVPSRVYTDNELKNANLFSFSVRNRFEPEGEACGTIYDDSKACEFCGAFSPQIGPLILKKSSIPKKDIVCTIAGEMVFSERFVDCFNRRNLKGASFIPVLSGNRASGYYQLIPAGKPVLLTDATIVKNDVFNECPDYDDELYHDNEGKIKQRRIYYHCPKGHLLGPNLVSEVHVVAGQNLGDSDIYFSEKLIGMRIGVLRPEPLYLCSPAFRNMVIHDRLKGCMFEVAYIEQ